MGKMRKIHQAKKSKGEVKMLSSLEISPFAGLKHKLIKFEPGLNIFTAPNEKGKSTLFQALKLSLLLDPELKGKKLQSEIASCFPLAGGDFIETKIEWYQSSGVQPFASLHRHWKNSPYTSSQVLTLAESTGSGRSYSNSTTVAQLLTQFWGMDLNIAQKLFFHEHKDIQEVFQTFSKKSSLIDCMQSYLHQSELNRQRVNTEKFLSLLKEKNLQFFNKWDETTDRPLANHRGSFYEKGAGILSDLVYQMETSKNKIAIQEKELERIKILEERWQSLKSQEKLYEKLQADYQRDQFQLQILQADGQQWQEALRYQEIFSKAEQAQSQAQTQYSQEAAFSLQISATALTHTESRFYWRGQTLVLSPQQNLNLPLLSGEEVATDHYTLKVSLPKTVRPSSPALPPSLQHDLQKKIAQFQVKHPMGFNHLLEKIAELKKTKTPIPTINIAQALAETQAEKEKALSDKLPEADLQDLREKLLRLQEEFTKSLQEAKALKKILTASEKILIQEREAIAHLFHEKMEGFWQFIIDSPHSSITLNSGNPQSLKTIHSIDLPVSALSSGTLSCLALAFRLASTQFFSSQPHHQQGQLPIILDDPLVDLDSARFARSARLLQTAAEKNQVIYFSCREDWPEELRPFIRQL
jgi:hypothetical protein